jgi:hypothetical protein
MAVKLATPTPKGRTYIVQTDGITKVGNTHAERELLITFVRKLKIENHSRPT